MQIGRKIFFDKLTGEKLVEVGKREDAVMETTVEYDITCYNVLSERNRDTFDVIELEYGQYDEEFLVSSGYRVNPDTKELEFSHSDPVVPSPEVFEKPLTDQIKEMSNRVEDTENAVLILMDMNLI